MNEKIKNEIERMMGGRGFIKEPVIVCDRILFLPDGGIELIDEENETSYIPEKYFISKREGFYKVFSSKIYLVPER
jgi:hypothetical protein